MKNFNVSQNKLYSRLLFGKSKDGETKCNVLFPDGTIIGNGVLILQNDANILLRISIHGVEFQTSVGDGFSKFKDLKYEIL